MLSRFESDSKRICWVSVVGDDPVLGGGVAKAVKTIKESCILDTSDYYSLYGVSLIAQFFLLLKCLFSYKYKRFVLHSFFSPFSLLLLLVPIKATIVILPHGELKKGALSISERKKKIAIFFVRALFPVLGVFKKISVIASNEEEIEFMKTVISIDSSSVIPDLISETMPITSPSPIAKGEGVNLVFISRMVPNKGISLFMGEILKELVKDKTTIIKSLNIFYTREDDEEFRSVNNLKTDIETKLGVNINMYEGLSHEKIKSVLNKLDNKMGFFSSKFESFGYALVESLGFEYKPYVWFDNELVSDLVSNDMCLKGLHGILPDICSESWLVPTDMEKVKSFLKDRNSVVSEQYRVSFNKMLR